VWIGGVARQLGLVDRFGGLNDAIAEAAKRAKLDPAKVHAEYLEKAPSGWMQFLAGFANRDDDDDGDWADQPGGADLFARVAAERQALVAQALGDARRMTLGGSIQARCLECAAAGPALGRPSDARFFDFVLARVGL
jgi:protease-4